MLPNNLKTVFLDFDGVVVESTDIKTQAFYEIYLPYGLDIAKKAMDYHIKHQGVSRYKKFEKMHKLFLNKACSVYENKKLARKFSEIVFKKILDCPFVDGILDFLIRMQNRKISIFLLSATPQDELLTICEKREILGYFKAIYGSPYEKSTVGNDIIQKCNLNREEAVFIGDSLSDFNAARMMNILFIGRVLKEKCNPFAQFVPIIKNFKEIIL